LGCKHFCCEVFRKGELRVVASTTYILSPEDFNAYITSSELLTFTDVKSGLIIRGEVLHSKRIKIDPHSKSKDDETKISISKKKSTIKHYFDLYFII
jgi:hypothetical protein